MSHDSKLKALRSKKGKSKSMKDPFKGEEGKTYPRKQENLKGKEENE